MILLALIGLHTALVAVVFIRVLSHQAAPGSATAWLLLAVFAPYFGVLLYALIGERRLSRQRMMTLSRRQEAFRRLTAPHVARTSLLRNGSGLVHVDQALQRAAERFFGVPALIGNSLALVSDSGGILRRIAADIDAARDEVLIEFYIWGSGGLARDVVDALLRAARRRVRCIVLVDAIGAGPWWRSAEPEELRAAGVELIRALPTSPIGSMTSRADLRLHRKIVAIDGTIAWTGSMNMVDPRFFKQGVGLGQWVDAMVRLEGPAAGLLAAVVMSDRMAERPGEADGGAEAAELRPEASWGSVPVQVLSSGPGETGDGLLQTMLAFISGAQHEVIITTPYFVPDEALIIALRGAAARGVRIVIVLPKQIDSLLVRHASRSHFGDILEMGGELHQFTAGFLHTKSITVDGKIALFGTANFDRRSTWLNYEVSLIIYDQGFVSDLRSLQFSYMQNSDRLGLAAWQGRQRHDKLLDSFVRLFSPLL